MQRKNEAGSVFSLLSPRLLACCWDVKQATNKHLTAIFPHHSTYSKTQNNLLSVALNSPSGYVIQPPLGPLSFFSVPTPPHWKTCWVSTAGIHDDCQHVSVRSCLVDNHWNLFLLVIWEKPCEEYCFVDVKWNIWYKPSTKNILNVFSWLIWLDWWALILYR